MTQIMVQKSWQLLGLVARGPKKVARGARKASMERENARGLLHSRSPDGREFAPGVLATWCEALRARGGAARGAAVAVVCLDSLDP